MNERHANMRVGVFEQNWRKCYAVDNNFAYKKDAFDADPSERNAARLLADVKCYNFVPTYDRWCLTCGSKQNVSLRCTKCRHVYFCNEACQRRAWPIHKRHCGRNVFSRCALCGKETNNLAARCPDGCGVVWCSDQCRSEMLGAHRDYDCAHFKEMFN